MSEDKGDRMTAPRWSDDEVYDVASALSRRSRGHYIHDNVACAVLDLAYEAASLAWIRASGDAEDEAKIQVVVRAAIDAAGRR